MSASVQPERPNPIEADAEPFGTAALLLAAIVIGSSNNVGLHIINVR